ncbi:hypothetical protein [Cryptosporangium sp. NPDC051539]
MTAATSAGSSRTTSSGAVQELAPVATTQEYCQPGIGWQLLRPRP